MPHYHQPNETVGDDLDSYFATAGSETAASTTGGTPGDVLAYLAEGEGFALVGELLAAGFDREIVAALLMPEPGDGRKKPKLRGKTLDGERWVWLTTGGWASAGRPSKREAPPAPGRLAHRAGPQRLEQWVTSIYGPGASAHNVDVVVARGDSLQSWVETAKSDAWSVVRNGGTIQQQADAGKLLGGVYPDAVLVEMWDRDSIPKRAQLYPHAEDAASILEPEWRIAVEVELSAKSDPMLGHKVRQHDRAMRCDWWHSVLWIVDDDEVRRRLTKALQALDPERAALHLFAHPAHVGLAPEPENEPMAPTWSAIDAFVHHPLRQDPTTTQQTHSQLKRLADIFTSQTGL